ISEDGARPPAGRATEKPPQHRRVPARLRRVTLVQQVLRPRSRLKALAQELLLFVAGTSCVHRTRSVETRALPASERPVLTEATGTPLRADWQVESGVLLGQLEWADACVLERSQTVVEEETIKKEPATGAGVALLVAGVATA